MAETTIQMRFPRASTSVGAAQDFFHFMVLFALLHPLLQRGPTYIYALLSLWYPKEYCDYCPMLRYVAIESGRLGQNPDRFKAWCRLIPANVLS